MSILDWTWNQVIDGFAGKFTMVMSTTLGKFVVKAMTFIGIQLVSYTQVVQPFVDDARAHWEGMPGDIMVWITALKLDVVVTILLSAVVLSVLKKVTIGRILPAGGSS
jgi:hypothetical protein